MKPQLIYQVTRLIGYADRLHVLLHAAGSYGPSTVFFNTVPWGKSGTQTTAIHDSTSYIRLYDSAVTSCEERDHGFVARMNMKFGILYCNQTGIGAPSCKVFRVYQRTSDQARVTKC